MHGAKDIVAQIRQKQPGIIEILIAQLLLVCQSAQDKVHQGRNLSRSGQVPAVTGAKIEYSEDQEAQKSNWESISCQSAADGALDRTGE